MINDKLNRLGDTSFRLKDQLNFYTNLIDYIFVMHQDVIETKIIYNQLKEDKIINYKDEQSSRLNFALKQLKEFSLLTYTKDILHINTKLKQIHYLLFNKKLADDFFDKTNFELNKVLFAILILFNESKNAKAFYNFIHYLYRNQISEITKQQIALFSICESENDLKAVWNKNETEVLDLLFTDLEIDDIAKTCTQITKENEKKLINDLLDTKALPKFRKWPTEFIPFFYFLRDFNLQKNNWNEEQLDELIRQYNLVSVLNNIKKLFLHNKKMSNTELVNKYDYQLINYYYKLKKEELIYGDYLDINARWFTKLGFISYESNKLCYSVKNIYLELYLALKKEFIVDTNIQQIIDYCLTSSIKNIAPKWKYPYSIEEVIDALNLFWQIKDNKKSKLVVKINQILDVFNIPLSLIYEYLINLAFALSYEYKPIEFRDICANTILDDELKPINHAVGHMSDGLIKENDFRPFSTIEATILENNMLYKEYEPIQRHSIKYQETLNNQQELPNVIFVYNNDYEISNLILFSSKNYAKYIHTLDQDKEIRIISLNTKSLIHLLQKRAIKDLLLHAKTKFPLPKIDDVKSYEELVESL